MGMNNAQLTEANKGLTKSLNDANEKLEALLNVSKNLDVAKDKLIQVNRETATLKQINEKLMAAAKSSTGGTAPEKDEDEIDEEAIELEARKAAAQVRRRPILEKREKNRAGRHISQLSKAELKIEEKCNADLRKLNTVVNGEAKDVLS